MFTKTAILIAMMAAAGGAACGTGAEQASKTPDTTTSSGPEGHSDARNLADFTARIDAYVKLRDTLDNRTAPLKKTDDPAAITVAERQLAEKLRAARPDAKPGEFFTPPIAQTFKRLLKPAVKGPEGKENRNAIADDNPEAVPFRISGEYPKEKTVSTVPPDVLLSLPALPETIQYRFVGQHLVLYDARANIIMDYLFHAVS